MTRDYHEIIKAEEDLDKFLKTLGKFNQRFSEHMFDRVDFTLKLEVHGAAGRLLHCRVSSDHFDRPSGVKRPAGRVNERRAG